jgi:IstB-like ATP binding protein
MTVRDSCAPLRDFVPDDLDSQPAPERVRHDHAKTLATATVDRLLHHAHVVLTEGTSLRLSEATAGRGVMPLN